MSKERRHETRPGMKLDRIELREVDSSSQIPF